MQREFTYHLQEQSATRSEITPQKLSDVLGNWVIRGVRNDDSGKRSIAYLSWVEHRGARRLLRVGVSMDDRRITTAFLDTTATEKLNSGDMEYFHRNYEKPEVRS